HCSSVKCSPQTQPVSKPIISSRWVAPIRAAQWPNTKVASSISHNVNQGTKLLLLSPFGADLFEKSSWPLGSQNRMRVNALIINRMRSAPLKLGDHDAGSLPYIVCKKLANDWFFQACCNASETSLA